VRVIYVSHTWPLGWTVGCIGGDALTPGTAGTAGMAKVADGPSSTMCGAGKSDGGLIAVMCCLVSEKPASDATTLE